jgi:hypothetical protein
MDVRLRRAVLSILSLVACASVPTALQAQQAQGPGTHGVHAAAPGGFVHAVYFWLRPELTREQRDAFVQGLQSLRGIETVRSGWIGVPAATDRPIIERGYSYALTLVFPDDAAQEAYQVHPVHDRFREEFGNFFTRVVIYDSVEVAGKT